MRILQVVINAVALLVAALLVPGISIDWGEDAGGILLVLVGLAVVFGLVNAFLRPVARLVSIPLNIATLGLFSLVVNAALLLGVAFAVDLVWQRLIVIGSYPPDLSLDTIAAAAFGSFVISAVSTALGVLIPDT